MVVMVPNDWGEPECAPPYDLELEMVPWSMRKTDVIKKKDNHRMRCSL